MSKWDLHSFVRRTKQRKMIIKALEFPRTPTEISSITKLSVAHISRTLKQFQNKGLVECVTPKEKFGRIYKLTEKGKEVLKEIKTS